MTEENRRENVTASIQRAADELAIGENCLRDGYYHATVSHAYYCALHSARALLFSEGLQAKTHGGVAHLVNVSFVRKGLLPPKLFQTLGHLEQDREVADYDAMAVHDEETAQQALSNARKFSDACRTILQDRQFL